MQRVELPALAIRAEVRPDSIDSENRTAEVVFSTGAPVERYDWRTDTRYFETLSLKPKDVRLERLNNSAPFLNAHSGFTLGDVLGVVVPGSARIVGGQGRAAVRFSKREDVEPIWQDVQDGILRNVSVGFLVHKYEQTEGEGKLPTRHAIDWEPYEISAVPMGADDGAKVRAADQTPTNPCVIVLRAAQKETPPMDPKDAAAQTQSETIVETDVLQPEPRKAAPLAPNEHDTGVQAERERNQGILMACRAARLTQDYADELIKSGIPLLDAQSRIFEELRKRGADDRGPAPGPSGGVRLGDDPLVHVRAGIENAILHRVAPEFFKLDDVGRKYRGMTMLDIGRAYLQARGVRTTELSKQELAGMALGLVTRSGMHTTSDFPLLLADVARKTLRAAYEEAPQTFKAIGRQVNLPDFKTSNRMQLGDAPALLKVAEHGEFTHGTIAESKEALRLETYGRIFAITRQALINDDTDAFSRVPTAFGRSARNLESDLVWAQITSNPVMGDGVVLFHANHGNLDASASVISVASLGKARAAMRVQKGLDGVTVLNITPRYLATPAALETTAATFLVQVTPAAPANVNPFAGLLQPLTEPRLDANSLTAWYLFAGAGTDVIEYAYLEGQSGPTVEDKLGWDIDGLELKCRLDFAAKIIDWRGVWKNPGA